ncbi:hypothetical protein [Olsenella uli]|uniref:hypothetical protein n=1 Tax=Olsenella uli TaxID=133926 RepID=UPI003D7B7262
MADKTGVARLRQAIENQWDAGEACFTLPIGEATAICDECEDELARLSWARGVPVPRDADGAVVPLAAEELYTNKGEKVLVDSICFNGFFWYVKDLRREPCRLDRLHRGERDSWEKLEEDAKLAPRAYLDKRGMNPEKTERVASMMADLVSRAKALVERDAKGADCD